MIISVPQLSGEETIEEVIEHVARLQKLFEFLLNGKLSSDNINVRSIVAESIAANTITANEIKAGAITTDKLDVNGLITALEGKFNAVVSDTVITYVLAADKAYIAELTVDQLETSDKVKKYLAGDTSEVNYIRAKGQYIEWVTAKTTGSATEQAKDRNGTLLYWKTAEHKEVTEEVTNFPILQYVYTEQVKRKIGFEDIAGTKTPVDVYGAGSGGSGNNGKGFITKTVDGLEINYYSTTGKLRQIKLTDNGIQMTPYPLTGITFYSNGVSVRYGSELVQMRWTTGSSGRILSLEDVETGEVTPIVWNDDGVL